MGSRDEDARSEEISLNCYQGRFIDRLKFHIPLRQYTVPTEPASGGRVEETTLKIPYLEKASPFASHIFQLLSRLLVLCHVKPFPSRHEVAQHS